MRSLGRTVLWVSVIVAVIIGVARATAIRWWRVPADDIYLNASLTPTLRGGDLVILWRLSKPTLGDLVLCPEPPSESESGNTGRIVVGRVVAEGGDSVAVNQGNVIVNGKRLPTEGACPTPEFTTNDPETETEVTQHCSMEAIGSNRHMTGRRGSEIKLPIDQPEVLINDGQVWLASDNRMFPFDSRDYGAVDLSSCKETIIFRLVSAKGYFDEENRLTFIR